MNIEHALVGEPYAHQHRKYKPKTTHDVYLYIPITRITEGAVRSYLRDIGVKKTLCEVNAKNREFALPG